MAINHALLPLGPMARRVRVTTGWLRDEAAAGRVPCLRAGERFLFVPKAVERALAKRATCGTAESRRLKRASIPTLRWPTPPAVAAELGVDPEKVGGWILAGELIAVNVAARIGGRPRWRIDPAELEAFLKRRQSPAPRAPRPRRRQTAEVIEFF